MVVGGRGEEGRSKSSQTPGKRERHSRGEGVLSDFLRDFSTRVMPSSESQKQSDRPCWCVQGGIFLLIHSTSEWTCWDSRHRARHRNTRQQVKQARTRPHGAFILLRVEAMINSITWG